jgi:hypothetical protein
MYIKKQDYTPIWRILTDEEVKLHENHEDLFFCLLREKYLLNTNKERPTMKKAILTLSILGMCIAGPAFAGQKNMRTTSTMTTTESHTTTYRKVAYKNLMSVVDRQSLQSEIERHVKKLDLDGDRSISKEEFTWFDSQRNIDFNASMDMFTKMDTNANGLVSSQEIMNWEMKQRATQALEAMAITPESGDVVYQEKSITYKN